MKKASCAGTRPKKTPEGMVREMMDMLIICNDVYICGVVGITDNNHKKGNNEFDPNAVNPDGTPLVRVRLPKKWNNEMFGSADLMMGANHIRVRCFDGVTRMGRIKGKIKKPRLDPRRGYPDYCSLEFPG